jgi:hypothetical protein
MARRWSLVTGTGGTKEIKQLVILKYASWNHDLCLYLILKYAKRISFLALHVLLQSAL